MAERATVTRRVNHEASGRTATAQPIRRADKHPLPRSLKWLIALALAGVVAFAAMPLLGDHVNRLTRGAYDLYAKLGSSIGELFSSQPARVVSVPPPPSPHSSTTPPPNAPPPRLSDTSAQRRPQPQAIFLARPPGASPQIVPYPIDTVRQYFGHRIAAFQAIMLASRGSTVPAERVAPQYLKEIYAAARLGYLPARAVIAEHYLRSDALRSLVEPTDAVRYALDFLLHNAMSDEHGRHDFLTVARHFAEENRLHEFAGFVFDVLREDHRLLTLRAITELLQLYHIRDAGCMSLRRHIGLAATSQKALQCDPDFREALVNKARAAGPVGLEERGFRDGILTFATLFGVPGISSASPPVAQPLPPSAFTPPPPIARPSPQPGIASSPNLRPAPPPLAPEMPAFVPRPLDATATGKLLPEAEIEIFVARVVSELGAASDEAARREIFRKLSLAAALGHRRMRESLVGFYRSQKAVRDNIQIIDIVRFSLDSLVHDSVWVEDSVRRFIQLGAFLMIEDAKTRFAESLLAAFQDEARLRTPEKSGDLMRVLARIDGACQELRLVLKMGNSGEACDETLKQRLIDQAAEFGPAGAERRLYEAAESRISEELAKLR